VLAGLREFPLDADTMKMLDDKFALQKLRSPRYLSRKPYLLQNPNKFLFDFANEKNKYILKSIVYDLLFRLDMTNYQWSLSKNGSSC